MKKDYGYPSYDLICRVTSGDEKAVREILDCKNKGRYTGVSQRLCKPLN